jgi:adenosylcobinamide kinase/adenosylcobinamide-phosphate guanylyltransferase
VFGASGSRVLIGHAEHKRDRVGREAADVSRTLILGGARSGKSQVAETRLADAVAVDYVATGGLPSADDPDWAERVRRHQARRPAHWRTVETLDLVAVLAAGADAPVALIECISTWLAAVMDSCGVWGGVSGADASLARRIDELVEAWTASMRSVIAVSSEVGLGVVPATPSGRRYCDELGHLNMRLAASADEVLFVVAGLPQRFK